MSCGPVAKMLHGATARRVIDLLQFAHVGCPPGQPEEPGAAVEQFLELIDGEVAVTLQRQQYTRIDRPAARAHVQAIKRRVTHSRGNTAAVAYCRGAAAVAEVENQQ